MFVCPPGQLSVATEHGNRVLIYIVDVCTAHAAYRSTASLYISWLVACFCILTPNYLTASDLG